MFGDLLKKKKIMFGEIEEKKNTNTNITKKKKKLY
jgi:hypothetical protein